MVIIALGGNSPSHTGSPIQTMNWAMRQMSNSQICVISCSSFYCTKPVGQAGQPDYVNAVVRVQTSLSAANVLKNLKLIEKTAGRNVRRMRTDGRWGPRPLDLDIVDYKGVVRANFDVCSREKRVTSGDNSRQCGLVLPHPRAHLRPFVIRPIVDLDPFWHHPVSGLSAVAMWTLLRSSTDGQILRRLD